MESSEPMNVRELLTEMKDVSDLMVDLAYATILFEDKELAKHMRYLEEEMDELMYKIRGVAAVVTRNIEEARQITGILQVASGAEGISNATGDIADLVRRGIKIHPVVREAFSVASEQIVKVNVAAGSVVEGKTFRELRLPSSIGVWTFGIKKGGKWILSPPSDTRIESGDTLLSKGPAVGVVELVELAGRRVEVKKKKFAGGVGVLRKALAEMRDLTVAMVDMAYSSLLFNSREIAEEVGVFEEKFDRLNYKLWLETLKAAKRERDLKKLNSILQVVRAMERISDAADSIADVIRREEELHPVFLSVMADSQEQIAKTTVGVDSPFVGKNLEELKLWKTMGAYIFMVKRGRRYVINPGKSFKINAGDVLFLRGGKSGVEKATRAGVGRR